MDLKAYLDEKGIRYNHFAEQIGITYKTLWVILCGNPPKKIKTAEKIIEVTDGKVRMKDLIKKSD